MRDDISQLTRGARGERGQRLAVLGLPLEGLVRRSARGILQRTIEAVVQVLMDEFAAVALLDGRRSVLRNGYMEARETLTTVGPVAAPEEPGGMTPAGWSASSHHWSRST